MPSWTRRRESAVEKYLKRRVKETGGKTRKVRWLDKNGAPDRLIWWEFPRVAFAEVKAEKKKVDWDSVQGKELLLLAGDGWPTCVIDSFEAVDRFIEVFAPQGLTV